MGGDHGRNDIQGRLHKFLKVVEGRWRWVVRPLTSNDALVLSSIFLLQICRCQLIPVGSEMEALFHLDVSAWYHRSGSMLLLFARCLNIFNVALCQSPCHVLILHHLVVMVVTKRLDRHSSKLSKAAPSCTHRGRFGFSKTYLNEPPVGLLVRLVVRKCCCTDVHDWLIGFSHEPVSKPGPWYISFVVSGRFSGLVSVLLWWLCMVLSWCAFSGEMFQWGLCPSTICPEHGGFNLFRVGIKQTNYKFVRFDLKQLCGGSVRFLHLVDGRTVNAEINQEITQRLS